MSQDDAAARSRVTTLNIDALKRWRQTLAAVAAGQLPTLDELRSGTGFAGGDIKADIRLWARDMLLENPVDDADDRLKHLHDACSIPALMDVRDALEHEGDQYVGRLDFYLAAMGVDDARYRVVADILGTPSREYRRVVFGLSVAMSWGALLKPQRQGHNPAEALIRSTAADIDMAMQAAIMLGRDEKAPSPEDLFQDAVDDALVNVGEDRAEITRSPVKSDDGLLVVGHLLPNAVGSKKEIGRSWEGIAGKPLPLVKVTDLVGSLKIINSEMPHVSELAMRIAMLLHVGRPFKLPPILFVGDPGCGKTTLCRLIARAFGVPSEVHNLAGSADASIGGTSAQYSSVRESSFLQQIKKERIANPVAILDELEKASVSRHNGSALDVILPMLEAHTAKRYRDPALEIEVDLSAITILATCNSLDGVPAPLRDRFVIYRMPDPTWQHVGTLSRNILNKIAEERALDARFFPSLANDELEALRAVWDGGSIRRLERAIRLMCDGRDALLGRA